MSIIVFQHSDNGGPGRLGVTLRDHGFSLDIRRLFWNQWSLLGSTMGSRREYRAIVRLAGRGHLWPVVDRVLPLRSAVEALQRLSAAEQFGKLVIEVTA